MFTRQKGIWMLAGFFLLTVLYLPAQLLAAPYFEGKRITIVVGYAAGGGYDRMARVLAKHLPKYIPGKPTIIVENMPGASSIIASNYIYNVAKPDGLTIGSIERGLPIAQLLKAEGIKFDLTKYSWIGSVASEATVLTLRTDLPYKTFDGLLKAKSTIMLGCTGPGDNAAQFSLLLKEFVGVNLKLINYPSNADIWLAIERKEVDGVGGSYTSMKPVIERGLIRPLVRSRLSEPGIEDLPVDEDLTADKMGKTIMAIRTAPCRVGRPYVAPPKTPADIVNTLRDAFGKAAQDQELKEDSKKLLITIDYLPADECLKVLNYVLNQPEDIVKEMSKYLKF